MKKIIILFLWLPIYIGEFLDQERALWTTPISPDGSLVLVRSIHLACLVLGFVLGLLFPYPVASPPAIYGGIVIAFIVGMFGYALVTFSRMDEVPEHFDVAQVDPFTFYRPHSLAKRVGTQEPQVDSLPYESKPWCDIAAWFLFASIIRLIAFYLLQKGSI